MWSDWNTSKKAGKICLHVVRTHCACFWEVVQVSMDSNSMQRGTIRRHSFSTAVPYYEPSPVQTVAVSHKVSSFVLIFSSLLIMYFCVISWRLHCLYIVFQKTATKDCCCSSPQLTTATASFPVQSKKIASVSGMTVTYWVFRSAKHFVVLYVQIVSGVYWKQTGYKLHPKQFEIWDWELKYFILAPFVPTLECIWAISGERDTSCTKNRSDRPNGTLNAWFSRCKISKLTGVLVVNCRCFRRWSLKINVVI